VFEAESLIRSLAGVASARVRTSGSAIESVQVEARDPDAARHLAGHVRSAPLATPVVTDRIHVSVARDTEPGADGAAAAGWGDPPDEERPGAGQRLRILRGEDNLARELDPAAAEPRQDRTPRTGDAHRPLVRRPRLVAVDVDRPGDGRVVCRVSIAYGTSVHRAEAVAIDLPGAAAQAAAQAAVRALLDAGLDGLELNGMREVEIAGHHYVLVALRREGTYPRHRSGSAPIVGSTERSAAEAAVAAADNMI
jgi:hypothetical protein